MPRLHVTVHGRVQGVGFRYFAERSARNHGLAGWVRNLWGGAVESEVEGPREALEAYLKDLQSGPSFAAVMQCDTQWFDEEGWYTDFQIRPTE